MAIDLKSISKASLMDAPKILLYGTPGIGKTTFASKANKPIFLFTEEGAGLLKPETFHPNDDEGDYVFRSFEDVCEGLAVLQGEHNHKTVVIDTLDGLEPLVWRSVCKKHGVDSIEQVLKGYAKGFTEALLWWERIKKGLNILRQKHKMTVILLAHSHIKKFDSPEVEAFDRYQLQMNEKACAFWTAWSDVVLFANYRMAYRKSDTGFGKEKIIPVGSGERVLYTEERPAFRAKNRYGLPAELPFDFAEFRKAVGNALNSEAGAKKKDKAKAKAVAK